jgi:hypothetical protein|tara:strand:+ start:601 stop:765 length:165 start_codon:yes stop_codon:yes gene_type:complete
MKKAPTGYVQLDLPLTRAEAKGIQNGQKPTASKLDKTAYYRGIKKIQQYLEQEF